MSAPGTWNEFLEGVLAGQPATVEGFARSALGELEPVNTPVNLPTGGPSVWGDEMWATMKQIMEGKD
jgi:hypothetical protein